MHRDFEIEGDIDADANQSGDPSPADLDGFVPLEVPLAAVVARLRNRTLVRVLSEAGRRTDLGER